MDRASFIKVVLAALVAPAVLLGPAAAGKLASTRLTDAATSAHVHIMTLADTCPPCRDAVPLVAAGPHHAQQALRHR